LDQRRVFNGCRPEYAARHTDLIEPLRSFDASDSASALHWNVYCLRYGAYCFEVLRVPGTGSIKIHDMDPSCSCSLKGTRYFYRVVLVLNLTVVVPLDKADALTVPYVDRRVKIKAHEPVSCWRKFSAKD
tara:strand:- start:13 stop:402 length:390 start_codon:yes stop_codon:yes gene_type:complete